MGSTPNNKKHCVDTRNCELYWKQLKNKQGLKHQNLGFDFGISQMNGGLEEAS
jgi:hypothetical protein